VRGLTVKRRGGGRAQKVGDQIQRELSDILLRELRDPRVGMVTITGVEVSRDCSYRAVSFTPLRPTQTEQAAEGLRRAAGFLRSHLARRIKMYTTPELRFAYDASVERGARLSQLIDSVTGKPKR
jgi:ribosome-binding factor A